MCLWIVCGWGCLFDWRCVVVSGFRFVFGGCLRLFLFADDVLFCRLWIMPYLVGLVGFVLLCFWFGFMCCRIFGCLDWLT